MKLALVLAAALFLAFLDAHAKPRLQVASPDGTTITLYDDPCDLKEVTNLPFKAVWQEGGKTYQGCWGPRADFRLVMAYFDDKTVALIPFSMLSEVKNI